MCIYFFLNLIELILFGYKFLNESFKIEFLQTILTLHFSFMHEACSSYNFKY